MSHLKARLQAIEHDMKTVYLSPRVLAPGLRAEIKLLLAVVKLQADALAKIGEEMFEFGESSGEDMAEVALEAATNADKLCAAKPEGEKP